MAETSAWTEQLDLLFAAWDRPDSPGCALAVYREGEIVYQRGYGMAHLEHGVPIVPQTVFHVASISKQVTALAVALLAREGRLALDDDVRRYVPELPAGPAITLRQILHHTSGLRDQWDLLRLAGFRHADLKTTRDIVWLAARQQGLNFEPGSRFQYINTGYTLLGVAVERITGRTLRQYTEERITRPLGMHSTFFQDDHQEVIPRRAQAYSRDRAGRIVIDMPDYETVGPTGLLSTVEDFARWERNFLAPTVGDEELIRQVVTPGLLEDGRPTSYGLGVVAGQYRGLPTVEHAGGDAGYRAHFLRFPGERFAVAVFANFGEVQPGKLAREVAGVCLAGRLAGESSGSGDVLAWAGRAVGLDALAAEELESMAGPYRESTGGITCRVEHRGGRLFLIAPGEIEYELAPLGERRFRFLGSDVDCLFQPGEGASPRWRIVVFHGGAETAVCERIDEPTAALDGGGAEYAGGYWSDELEALYTLVDRDGELLLERPRAAPAPLRLQAPDQFSDGDGKLHFRFQRGEEGRVQGLTVSAERVWNVRFVRDTR